MYSPWKQINSTKIAENMSEQVCWPDSDLSYYIFCDTSITLDDGSSVAGLGLRFLISCCSTPCSYLEICLLDITEPVSLPLTLSHFNGYIDDDLQFRFSFHYDSFDSRCQRAFYRFIDIDHSEAHRVYTSPSVLSASEGPLSREGYTESKTPDGGHIILTGNDNSPTLSVTSSDKQECEVNLDFDSAKCLVDSLHILTNKKENKAQ